MYFRKVAKVMRIHWAVLFSFYYSVVFSRKFLINAFLLREILNHFSLYPFAFFAMKKQSYALYKK